MKIETFKQAQRLLTEKRQIEITLDNLKKSSLQADKIAELAPTYERIIAELQQKFDELNDGSNEEKSSASKDTPQLETKQKMVIKHATIEFDGRIFTNATISWDCELIPC